MLQDPRGDTLLKWNSKAKKVAAVLSQLLLAAALWLMVALKVAAVEEVASKAEATLELSDPRMMQHDAIYSMTRRQPQSSKGSKSGSPDVLWSGQRPKPGARARGSPDEKSSPSWGHLPRSEGARSPP